MSEHQQLEEAFARPGRRGAGLHLPPRQPRDPSQGSSTRQETTETAAPAQAPPPAANAKTAAPEPAPPRAPRRSGTSTDRALVLMPPSLRDRLKAVATSKGLTYRDLVFDAIEATIDRLPDLIAARTGSRTHNTGLFERTTRTPAAPSAEGRVQVTIRGLSPQNREVLQDLTARTAAPSLTALIVTALDEHLPERPRALR